MPFQPEYGFGAIGEGGARVIDDDVVHRAVIPGATQLLEEPEALGRVTDLAGDWFARHFAQVSAIAAAA